MKYLKERQLAQSAMKAKLGFAPTLDNIIPLESSVSHCKCTYVMFQVKGNDQIIYRANANGLTIETQNKEIEL